MTRDERNSEYCRMPRSLFHPLRITAWMETPVVGDFTLPLDAIIYYMAHRDQLGAQYLTGPGSALHAGRSGASLPLARCEEHGPMWYYAASFAEWGASADGLDHWNSRIDVSQAYLIDFRGKRGKIDISSSTYKAYHQPIFYRHSATLRWYALGHAESLRHLLRFATHLGKKTSQGWGAVARWEVEDWREDWSVRRDGQPMRAIPAECGLLAGYRAPYWQPRNQAPCEMPSSDAAARAHAWPS